jgi:hypothetical protein
LYSVVGDLFDLDRLYDADPFEIDVQLAHLFKHHPLGVDDIFDVGDQTHSSTQPNHPHAG